VNAIQLLKQDHQKVESLFADYETATGDERKQEVVRDITRELSIHAAVEELLVYPAVRTNVGSDQTNHAIDEHQEVKRLLADLEKLSASDAGFSQKMATLMSSVRDHVKEEENEILPELEGNLSAERLDQMGSLAERIRGLLPTHPHPMVPGTAMAQLMAGPLASMADRVRDFVEGLRGKN
jgi:hemerythrin superfamily protein